MAGTELILNGAYIALLISAFTRTLTWLRIMLIVAAAVFIVFGIVEDIWTMVAWNILIGGMHLTRIVRERRQRGLVVLTQEEQAIRDEFFAELSDFDFHLLWCLGEPTTFNNELIIEAGTIPEAVLLVVHGAAGIEHQGDRFAGVGRGGLLGEMSYVSSTPADVDVRAVGELEVHRWDKRRLASLDHVHPSAGRAFRELIEQNLVRKVQNPK